MATVLDTALAAQRLGISVIPIEADGSKAPIRVGDGRLAWSRYARERATEQEIRQWFSVSGRGLAVIGGNVSGSLEIMDFDSLDAYEQFTAAAREEGMAPLVTTIENGYKEKTPKGIHWIYRCKKTEGNLKLASDESGVTLIETRGSGGYVIIAPSNGTVHPTGGKYSLVSGGIETIATIGVEDRAMLHDLARSLDRHPQQYSPPVQATQFAKVDNGQGKRVGDDYNERADWNQILTSHGWRRKFRNMWQRPGKPAHEGCSATLNYRGTDKLYVFSSSASPFQPMRSYDKFAATAILDYGGDFIEATKALGRQGYGTKEIPVPKPDTPAVKPQPEKKKPQVEVFDAAGLLDLVFAPIRWIIPRLLPEGSTLCAARPKSGKSWLFLALSVAVAEGGRFMEMFDCERGEALYCALEDNKRRLQDRMRLLLNGRPVPAGLNFVLSVPKIGEGFIEWLHEYLEAHPNTRLVVIDTLSKIKPQKGKDESVYESDYKAGEGIKSLADKFRVAIVMVYHTRKAEAEDPLEKVSGSFGLTGGVDNVWIIDRKTNEGEGKLAITGRDIEEQDLAVTFDKDRFQWVCRGDAAMFGENAAREEVFAFFRERNNKPSKLNEIALALGKRNRNEAEALRQLLIRMRNQGRLSESANSMWSIAHFVPVDPKQSGMGFF